MEKLAERESLKPIDRESSRGRGDEALSEEIRRTLAWIDYCEAQIAELIGDAPLAAEGVLDHPLAWGRQKVEEIGAAEFEGVNTTYAAGVNVWEEKLRWNRQHLASLTKQWIAAGFEAKRLELHQRTVDAFERALDGIIRDLGANPRDAETRAIVRRRLEEATKPREIEA